MKWFFGLEFSGQVVQKVQQPGINGSDITAAVISQNMVYFLQGCAIILPFIAIADREMFVGMKVVKA